MSTILESALTEVQRREAQAADEAERAADEARFGLRDAFKTWRDLHEAMFPPLDVAWRLQCESMAGGATAEPDCAITLGRFFIEKARRQARESGVQVAARNLRKQGVGVELALRVLRGVR